MATYKITCTTRNFITMPFDREGFAVLETGCSREEVEKRMNAYAIKQFGDDYNVYYDAIEAANWVIEEESGIEGVTPKEWIEKHPDEVEQLINDNINWEGQGLYTNSTPAKCVYKFGDDSFEDDGYTYTIEEESMDEDYYSITEDEDNWIVDMHTGMGAGVYPKSDWTKEAAIADQKGLFK